MDTLTHMDTNIINKEDDIAIIDFHSHILPGIDDGAETIEDSLDLIKEELNQGVKTIVLTPHFYPETHDYYTFIENRNQSYQKLRQAIDEYGINVNLRLAAEVKFTPKLLEFDLEPLCVDNTNYILIEFSLLHYHSWTMEVFYNIQRKGFYPIIAHAERYQNMDYDDLYELISAGALVQVNTGSLFKSKKMFKKVQTLINHDMVHIFGTDTHSMDKRPPSFDHAIEVIQKKWGTEYLNTSMQYADDILKNNLPFTPDPSQVKKKWLF